MTADILLSRLEGVRRASKGWTARCHAHEDRSASLSIAEGDDGRVLVHCFASCSAADVLGAVGLTLADMYPERIKDHSPLGRAQRREAAQAANWAAALRVLAFESKIVSIAANDLAHGTPLNRADADRLALALARIDEAQEVFNGR